jgi:hypothetical protein
MPQDGNRASASPCPSEASEFLTETTGEQPIEIKERNLSDGFLQIAVEIEE